MAEAPTTKAELLALISARWDALQELLSRLDAAGIERPLGDSWSAKVHLAHIAAWERGLTAMLLKEERPSAMGVPHDAWATHDTDRLNDVIARYAEIQPLFEVQQAADATHAELLDVLNELYQEELERPYSHYQPNDLPPNANPVVGWVHGNTWDHWWSSRTPGRATSPRLLAAEGIEVVEFIPKEGAEGWMDAWMVVKDTPNRECAYKFLNMQISELGQCRVANVNGYSATNAVAAKNCMSPEQFAELHQDDPAYLDSLKIWTALGDRFEAYTNAWNAVKAQ